MLMGIDGHTVREGNFNSKPQKQFHYCYVLSCFYDFICFATMHSSQENSYFFIEKKIKLDQEFDVNSKYQKLTFHSILSVLFSF